MKILITGCNGYTGSRLATFLREKNYEVVGLSRNKPDVDFTFYQGDVRNKELLQKIIKDEDVKVIFHLAAVLKNDNEEENFDINVKGTRNLAEVFSESDAEKLIFSSSGKVYGKINEIPTLETHALNGSTPYGKSKVAAEQELKKYSKEGKQIIILRQTYLYGKGMKDNFLIPTIIKQIKESGTVTLRNTDVKRDFIHIDDLLDLYHSLLEKDFPAFDVFNVSYGQSISLRKIIEILAKQYNKNVEIKNLNQPEENDEELLDTSKIKQVLNWKPKINYEEGLKRCI